MYMNVRVNSDLKDRYAVGAGGSMVQRQLGCFSQDLKATYVSTCLLQPAKYFLKHIIWAHEQDLS